MSVLASPPMALLADASLFLDFDGTLVEIADHPGAVRVQGRLRALLIRLSALLPGRLGIISGRPIAELDRLLGPTSLAFAGSHGTEIRWPDGRLCAAERPNNLAPLIRQISRLQKLHSGIVIERKPFGVAIHYRNEPQAEAACRQLAVALSQSSGLALQVGKMVIELRVPGADKGTALRQLADGTHPVFIGDDDTDEAGFAVATALGGAGILVGPQRLTAARYRLDSVTATLDWLDAACGVPR